jgi:hypothetical protein
MVITHYKLYTSFCAHEVALNNTTLKELQMACLNLINLLLPIPMKWVYTNYKLESAGKINENVCMFMPCTPRQKLEVSLYL